MLKPWTHPAENQMAVMDVSELESQAWHRARTRKLIELGAAILSCGLLVTVVTVCYRILIRS